MNNGPLRSTQTIISIIKYIFNTVRNYFYPDTNNDSSYEEEIIPTHIDTNNNPILDPERYRLNELLAYQAIGHRADITNAYYQNSILHDDTERLVSGTSSYDRHCLRLNWSGDVHPQRIWYDTTIDLIDNTIDTPFYSETDSSNEDSNYYQSRPTDYQEIITPITRNTTIREYGRVFFSTETRYVPYGTRLYPRRKPIQVRGYITKGNRRIFCPTYVNPTKGLLYRTKTPGGILKELTTLGILTETILNNRNQLQTLHDYNDGHIAYRYFQTLRERYNYQTLDWAYDTSPLSFINYEVERQTHQLSYQESWNDFETHIDFVHNNRLRYKYCCIRIQRTWNKHLTSRIQAKTKIVNCWRKYVLRRIGTEYTIVSDNRYRDNLFTFLIYYSIILILFTRPIND